MPFSKFMRPVITSVMVIGSVFVIGQMSISKEAFAIRAADPILDQKNPSQIPAAVHGMAMHGQAKYGSNFKYLDYVNPDAPKGGTLKLSVVGTFDSLNGHIMKGVPVAGLNLTTQSLLESTKDEAFSEYGLVAKTMEVAADKSWVVFNLRRNAKWHDGAGITADDVVWSFKTLMAKGHPFYKAYYADVKDVIEESSHRVKFIFKVKGNGELPLIVGQMPLFPKHYWADKDFSKTTLVPPLGSGPYKVKKIEAGRRIVLERVKDWWGKDLPINKGRYNFDTISFDYYRDGIVELQALFSGDYDFRQENIAKSWSTSYDLPAVKKGELIKAERAHEMPQGMQGFAFNIRRDIFKNQDVRRAIGLTFDFEWSNKQFAFGAYKRSLSYFSNSELASTGLPMGRELKILKQFEGKIPQDVFTSEYKLPITDGSGRGIRTYLKRAASLLDDAGWEINGEGLREKNGKTLSFEVLSRSPSFERWVNPWIANLKRIGVRATFRVVDTSQYQNRMDNFDFDVTIATFGQSLSPGNEQRDFWSSQTADVKGSRNIIGIKDPVIDQLIEKIIQAPNRDELVNLTRALDRVLLWGDYLVPQWHIDYFRLAYWNKFGKPKVAPKYGLAVIDTWWANLDGGIEPHAHASISH